MTPETEKLWVELVNKPAKAMERIAELEADRDELRAEVERLKQVIRFAANTGRMPTGYVIEARRVWI